MNNVLVLGGGRIGAAIAQNLSQDNQVTLVDLSIAHLTHLSSQLSLISADVSDFQTLSQISTGFDWVVGALPSRMGFNCLKQLIELEKNVVDISFFAEDALSLDALAKQKNVTAVVDFGLAPGLSNLFAGHFVEHFDEVDDFTCMVGGVPVERLKPFEYKAPFAPLDVIEEYTRPARMKRHGKQVIFPAMSEIESVYFKGIGHMEAFNTDGLRSLLQTVNIPNMSEKTIRYNGHAQFIQKLIDAGFFTPKHIENTAKVLLEQWQFADNEPDLTVMQIKAKGTKDGQAIEETYQLIDHYDEINNISSMARTTGYTCAAGLRLATNHTLPHGVLPPEIIGQNHSWFKQIITDLAKEDVIIEKKYD